MTIAASLDFMAKANNREDINLTVAFQEALIERFSVGPRFLSELIAMRNVNTKEPKEWDDLSDGSDMSKAYLHFALSNVVRGRQARDKILKHFDKTTGSYLDIGCAYGGYVVAFGEAGFSAQGIELADDWASLGSINCEEHGHGQVIRGDFFDLSPTTRYDIITCNDVIEHVQYPREALNKMHAMLNSGGLLYLTIPNRRSIRHIKRDGHYGLFGIGLLEHYAAAAYYNYFAHRFQNRAYSCGEMYDFSWYKTVVENFGFAVTEIVPYDRMTVVTARAQFDECLEMLKNRKDFACIDEKLQEAILSGFYSYSQDFWRSLSEYEATGQGNFQRDFTQDFWTLICKK